MSEGSGGREPSSWAPGDRTRTSSWRDPRLRAELAGSLAGIVLLRKIFSGELPSPPIVETLDIESSSIEAGEVVFSLKPAEFHYNPIGSVHGGVIATILDSAAGCAVHSTLAAGEAYTSADLSVKFLRPVTLKTGRVRAIGTLISRSSRTALAEARLLDATDRLLAYATSSCLIWQIQSG
jgi:uncharacterized protein (TIGR00369 family)